MTDFMFACLVPGHASIILHNVELHTDFLGAQGVGPRFSKKHTNKQEHPTATLFGFGLINCEISFKFLVK